MKTILINLKDRARQMFTQLFWSKASWGLYLKLVKYWSGRAPNDEDFLRLGIKQGLLPKDIVNKFKEEIERFESVPFSINSSTPGFHSGVDSEEVASSLNQSHIYLQPDQKQLEACREFLSLMERPIENCLGYPLQVVNIRFWKTPPKAEEKGPNRWHTDGMPGDIMKMLLYFSDVSTESGSTEIILKDGEHRVVEGPAGTWVLFWNSKLLHRGLAPQSKGERIVCEITLTPSFHSDFHPAFAGHNASFPLFPWSVGK